MLRKLRKAILVDKTGSIKISYLKKENLLKIDHYYTFFIWISYIQIFRTNNNNHQVPEIFQRQLGTNKEDSLKIMLIKNIKETRWNMNVESLKGH